MWASDLKTGLLGTPCSGEAQRRVGHGRCPPVSILCFVTDQGSGFRENGLRWMLWLAPAGLLGGIKLEAYRQSRQPQTFSLLPSVFWDIGSLCLKGLRRPFIRLLRRQTQRKTLWHPCGQLLWQRHTQHVRRCGVKVTTASRVTGLWRPPLSWVLYCFVAPSLKCQLRPHGRGSEELLLHSRGAACRLHFQRTSRKTLLLNEGVCRAPTGFGDPVRTRRSMTRSPPGTRV